MKSIINMKSIAIALLLSATGLLGFSQAASWTIQPAAKVSFKINNFGSPVPGTLTGLSGTILFDSDHLAESKLDVKVDVSTIDTDNGSRDKHLKNEDFFEVETYPYISFTSTSIGVFGSGYQVTGKLKIKNTEKVITIPFYVTESGNKAIFTSEFEINRLDYGVGSSSAVMGETVKINISIPATQ